MTELAGKNVVITGAGSGLGAGWARAAAALGAKIVVNDIDAETAAQTVDEIRSSGGEAVAAVQDIADPRGAEAVIQRCIDSFGSISCLINNAAYYARSPLWETDVDQLRKVLDVNVVGTFNCARAAVVPMMAQKSGLIINVISAAHMGLFANTSYSASKGATASFTYTWALDLADSGVRVNAISPLAHTPMAGWVPNMPPVEDNVPPMLYMLSDRSCHLNGQIIRIAGKSLSLLAHPAVRAPVLEREEWTLDSVAQAFDEVLNAKTVPVGIVTYDVTAIS